MCDCFPGGQPQWPNRYPAPGYGPPSGDRPWPPPTAGPQGPPPPGPGPAGQWSGDRPMYYGSSGSGAPPGPWGSSKSAMRPPYRPDLRGPVPMGPQRPVREINSQSEQKEGNWLYNFGL